MKNSDYIKNSIKNLKDYAKSKGFKIVWRNVTTNCGDFCIFIYNLNTGYHSRYLVGFDGDWDATDNRSFDNCLEAAHEYIRNYNK